MLRATWDATALAQINALAMNGQAMQSFMDDLDDVYGAAGVDFIKSNVKGNGYWQPSTGKTAAGIDYEVERRAWDHTIRFVGTNMTADGKWNIAHMIDVGNFDENTELWASGLGNGLGFKAFPISARAGHVETYLSVIRGMGATSKEYPKHFSDNAVYELRDRTPQLAEDPLQRLLNDLVV